MTPRFSGHETFPCRYAWLPKVCRQLKITEKLFLDEDDAIIKLGVGKNMVRAIRFWVQAMGVGATSVGGLSVTPFGRLILDDEQGFDPFLEDIQTLWLLHWKLCSQVESPLYAWHHLFNEWPHPEFRRSDVLKAFQMAAPDLSPVTLDQHFHVFLHTYLPTSGRRGEVLEDNLDCPLVELRLIEQMLAREASEWETRTQREPVYAFRREPKPEIGPELFHYCVQDFWHNHRPGEKTLDFRDLALKAGGPGQIFKLPEWDLRERLVEIENTSEGALSYDDAAVSDQLQRAEGGKPWDENVLLAEIYGAQRV